MGGWSRDRRTVEQGPACGMRPGSRSMARRPNADPMRVTGGQIPEGPSSAPRRAPVSGDATQGGRAGALSRGPGVSWGMRPRRRASSRHDQIGLLPPAVRRLRGRTSGHKAIPLPTPAESISPFSCCRRSRASEGGAGAPRCLWGCDPRRARRSVEQVPACVCDRGGAQGSRHHATGFLPLDYRRLRPGLFRSRGFARSVASELR